MTQASSHDRLQAAIATGRCQIAAGERPRYHAIGTTTPDGSTVDVVIRELPIIHAFVPDNARVLDCARALIARMLSVDAESFDVELDQDRDRDRR
jgi:hypothetical protein